ncbi:MAG TPA: hypothetical protein VH369_18435 [Bryobacteraceae bacterium]|jgi:hypothetical protein
MSRDDKARKELYQEKRELEKKEACEDLKKAVAEFERDDPDHWQQVILARALRSLKTGCYAEAEGETDFVFVHEALQSQSSLVHNEPVKPWNKDVFLQEIEAVYAAPAIPQFKNAL